MGGLAKKQDTVQQIRTELDGATITLVVDYRGLSVAEITALRQELYKNNTRLTVMKNTLVRRAIEGSDLEALGEFLKGPTALAVGKADQVTPVKILKDYFKKNKKENEIRGGVMDGKALSAAEVITLSELPSFDELRAKLVGGIASPLNGIVASLSGPQRALANVLDQLAKQKQQQE